MSEQAEQSIVNEALSRFYGQPVVAGFTFGGWPVVRPAGDPTAVVDGGQRGTLPSAVEDLLKAQAALATAVEEFDGETADREQQDEVEVYAN